MTDRIFEEGRCYFLVGYLDRHFKYPFVETYVFLGPRSDATGDDTDVLWIFQDVHSFFKYGEHRSSDDSRDIEVLSLDSEGLDTILDADALSGEFRRLGI
jgi:hypothetical protein